MESFGHERRVRQGEDWNLDITLSASNREYIPFIVSSQRNNPFFVVTIASTKYEKNFRYVRSWWNSVDNLNIPTFYQTTPRYYGELSELPTDPSAIEGESAETRYLYQYTLASDAIDITVGHKPYYYFYFDYSGETPVRIDNYSCRLRFNFPSSVTAEWTGQNYLYQITLVSGQLMQDRLNEIYDFYKPVDWPKDNIEAQYKYVKIQYPKELQPDIDIDSPLGYIEIPEPILQPTKLEVFNNLRTLI